MSSTAFTEGAWSGNIQMFVRIKSLLKATQPAVKFSVVGN